METNVSVSLNEFYYQFPEFSEIIDDNVEIYLQRAQRFISTYNGGSLVGENRALAIYLMTAHLMTLQNAINKGDTTSLLQASASIDKISVSNIPPPTDEHSYWYFLTSYGQQLLELFDCNLASPMYFGGSYVRIIH